MKGLAEACCLLMLALPICHRPGIGVGSGLHVLLFVSVVCAWGGIENCAWVGQGLGGACPVACATEQAGVGRQAGYECVRPCAPVGLEGGEGHMLSQQQRAPTCSLCACTLVAHSSVLSRPQLPVQLQCHQRGDCQPASQHLLCCAPCTELSCRFHPPIQMKGFL